MAGRKGYRVLFVIMAVFSICLTGCAKDIVTGKSTLNYYSLEGEPKLGKQVLYAQSKAIKQKGKKLDMAADPEEYQRIRRIVANIAPHTHYPKFPYEVHLADVDIVNAWCAPGGKMMVYTGLWDKKKGLVKKGDDDELAAVLAHEMAHANARHVTEAISRTMTIALAGAAVQTAIAAGGSSQGANVFGQIFSDGMNIYIPSYSRGNEYEADRLGLFYMARAGYDPRVAVRLWKTAAKRKKDVTNIYASHPASGARARALEKLLPKAMVVYQQSKAGAAEKRGSVKKSKSRKK